MVLDRMTFTMIPHGKIFRTVITGIQTTHQFPSVLKFVCKKGQVDDWAIYFGAGEASDVDVMTHGFKLLNTQEIQDICPCTPEVLRMYRR